LPAPWGIISFFHYRGDGFPPFLGAPEGPDFLFPPPLLAQKYVSVRSSNAGRVFFPFLLAQFSKKRMGDLSGVPPFFFPFKRPSHCGLAVSSVLSSVRVLTIIPTIFGFLVVSLAYKQVCCGRVAVLVFARELFPPPFGGGCGPVTRVCLRLLVRYLVFVRRGSFQIRRVLTFCIDRSFFFPRSSRTPIHPFFFFGCGIAPPHHTSPF